MAPSSRLSDDHKELLQELGDVASGAAALALSQLFQVENASFPYTSEVEVVRLEDLPTLVDHPTKRVFVHFFEVPGEWGMTMLLVLPGRAMREIVAGIAGEETVAEINPEDIKGLSDLSSDALSAITSASQSLAKPFISTLENILAVPLRWQSPEMGFERIMSLLIQHFIQIGITVSEILAFQSEVDAGGRPVELYFLIIPHDDSLEVFLSRLEKAARGDEDLAEPPSKPLPSKGNYPQSIEVNKQDRAAWRFPVSAGRSIELRAVRENNHIISVEIAFQEGDQQVAVTISPDRFTRLVSLINEIHLRPQKDRKEALRAITQRSKKMVGTPLAKIKAPRAPVRPQVPVIRRPPTTVSTVDSVALSETVQSQGGITPATTPVDLAAQESSPTVIPLRVEPPEIPETGSIYESQPAPEPTEPSEIQATVQRESAPPPPEMAPPSRIEEELVSPSRLSPTPPAVAVPPQAIESRLEKPPRVTTLTPPTPAAPIRVKPLLNLPRIAPVVLPDLPLLDSEAEIPVNGNQKGEISEEYEGTGLPADDDQEALEAAIDLLLDAMNGNESPAVEEPQFQEENEVPTKSEISLAEGIPAAPSKVAWPSWDVETPPEQQNIVPQAPQSWADAWDQVDEWTTGGESPPRPAKLVRPRIPGMPRIQPASESWDVPWSSGNDLVTKAAIKNNDRDSKKKEKAEDEEDKGWGTW